ncbi:Transcription activator [Legionella birminghamensis]|uniref:Transcription activator n=1 Tax=Legionella birminghamensis TaxID=28083 RepID=A0A378IE94_9GAMM|nr:effector binding domain-containing protein [Legionella birminghamensis]KTC72569.1 Transcription activator [Legionella birminghamensis]STX32841.1 Transcription activator, effector binding [Legionella birminghamensis]
MLIQAVETIIPPFTVTGFRVKTRNSEEFNPETAKIPMLWQDFFASELATESPVFGVYSDYESDANGFYTVTAGVSQNIPDKTLNKVLITGGKYLVFEATGPMPVTVINAWKAVWNYFEAHTAVQRKFVSDFESYSSPEQVAIHIGIA